MAEDGKEVFIEKLTMDITTMQKKIQADRISYIRDKLSLNRIKLAIISSELFTLAKSRQDVCSDNNTAENNNMLSLRKSNMSWNLNNPTDYGFPEKDNTYSSSREELTSPTIVFGKWIFNPIKLPFFEKIPPYTTWIFLARNQRMVDEQSVVGRRQIYYDQLCGETLICSDSETEMAEPEEEKHNFSEGEDQILFKIINEYGSDNEVINILRLFINAASFEISERYENLLIKHQAKNIIYSGKSPEEMEKDQFLNKTLSAALDSYDNLFCRRCFTFDCRLHGCSPVVILPSEKLPLNLDSDGMEKPCGDQCYILRNGTQDHFIVTPDSEAENSNSSNISTSRLSYNVYYPNKKQKENENKDSIEAHYENQNKYTSEASGSSSKKEWKPIEKDLFLKGLEIFGRNSCLVAMNLLSGLKTCTEVYRYMFHDYDTMLNRSMKKKKSSRNNTTDPDYMEAYRWQTYCSKKKTMPTRARTWRRRGRGRKLKYTWKSTGYPSIRKHIADGKERCRKYVPCGCQQMCGKDCPCHKNGTCCEKYCGCSKSCKNRFRGCHCAKSQCMSRQCPCFASGRECDPDVCRNCWVTCGGDTSLGEPAEPPSRGDDYQCGNMKLLLRQQEKILLGKSDVAGWGAFLKNPVNKHTYLGEYTGELISHKEADKRGKIYDISNSSFLFDLNDQYVLDAYRKGDKLKFANHSSNPNCYAKIMLVAGDHRVGIFANERIEASEELFYDYRYGDNEAPAWARKPEGSKKEDSSHNNKRAYKIA